MKKFNFLREKTFNIEIHRAGWNWVIGNLRKKFHDEKAEILVDDFIERTFDWDYCFNNDRALTLPHHKQKWIGFIHNPLIIPQPFDFKQSPINLCARLPFILATKNCQGIFTLSSHLEQQLKYLFNLYGFDNITIETLLHPTPLNVKEFDLDAFLENKQITCLGYWLRSFEQFWLLDTPIPKNVLLGRLPYAHQTYDHQIKSFEEKQIYTGEDFKGNVPKVYKHLLNDEFDDFLIKSIVFLNIIDSSANNGVIDCIARNIPLLVNCHPAVVEYLGEDYPFYYNSQETANKKVNDISLVKETYEYLKNMDKSRLSIEGFIKEFEESQVVND